MRMRALRDTIGGKVASTAKLNLLFLTYDTPLRSSSRQKNIEG